MLRRTRLVSRNWLMPAWCQQVLPRPGGNGKFGFSMAFSSDAVYLAVSERPPDEIRVWCMLVEVL
jgi:hypothetical protein